MFLFKEGSRNAFNQDRLEEEFSQNYQKLFQKRLPHGDTVDSVLRILKEDELEKLKTHLVRTLLKRKVFHKFRFLSKYFLIAVDATHPS